jgi:hypothetical protein
MEPGGGVFAGQTFKVAKDDYRSITVREAFDFLVDHGFEVVGFGTDRFGFKADQITTRPRSFGSGSKGDADANSVKPAAERVLNPDGSGLLDQDQERGLKRVLGGVRVAQDPPASPPDHRSVSSQERLKGSRGLAL